MDKKLPKSTGKKDSKIKKEKKVSLFDNYSIKKPTFQNLPEVEENNERLKDDKKTKNQNPYSIVSDLSKSLFSTVNKLIENKQNTTNNYNKFFKNSIFSTKLSEVPQKNIYSDETVQFTNYNLSNEENRLNNTKFSSDKTDIIPYMVGFKSFSKIKENNEKQDKIFDTKLIYENNDSKNKTEKSIKNIIKENNEKTKEIINNGENLNNTNNNILNTPKNNFQNIQNSNQQNNTSFPFNQKNKLENKNFSNSKNSNFSPQSIPSISQKPENNLSGVFNSTNNFSNISQKPENNLSGVFNSTNNFSNVTQRPLISTSDISNVTQRPETTIFQKSQNFISDISNPNQIEQTIGNKTDIKESLLNNFINNTNSNKQSISPLSNNKNLNQTLLNTSNQNTTETQSILNSTNPNEIKSSVERKPIFHRISNANYIQYPGSDLKIPSFFEGGSVTVEGKQGIPSLINTPAGLIEAGKDKNGQPMKESITVTPSQNNYSKASASELIMNEIRNTTNIGVRSSPTIQEEKRIGRESNAGPIMHRNETMVGGQKGDTVTTIVTMDTFEKVAIETFMLPKWRLSFG